MIKNDKNVENSRQHIRTRGLEGANMLGPQGERPLELLLTPPRRIARLSGNANARLARSGSQGDFCTISANGSNISPGFNTSA